MEKVLNITNGDCAANIMREAKIEGTILPWRDLLHEGPVPDLPLDELSLIRASYIADRGWGKLDKIKQSFQQRDLILKNCHEYQLVILWFEHDLYDQLQLIQILAWLAREQNSAMSIELICVDRYLGRLNPVEMHNLLQLKTPVTKDQLMLATRAWASFCSPDPTLLSNLLNVDTSALPYLEGAIHRMLEEYADAANGLSRTANTLLTIVDQGSIDPTELFDRYTQTEQRAFLGDASFWKLIDELLHSNPPLVVLPEAVAFDLPPRDDQLLTITEAGKAVLAGEKDATSFIPLDRWIGGVHLTPNNDWRWNCQTKTLNRRRSSESPYTAI